MTERFDPVEMLRILGRHKVEFVLIGGLAAAAHGSPSVTQDAAICYSRPPENLRRLASALVEMKARLRGAPEDLPFQLDAESIARGDRFTFETHLGSFGILATPAGTKGYEDLAKGAIVVEIEDLSVKVASIDDLIRVKKASARPKDLAEAEILGALRDEIDRGAQQ